ncbi:MAG: hypothetical protein ACKV2U_24185 [Bryobacteraceae bacterium]
MRRAGSVAGVALMAVSCGYVGDPLPPALNIPQPVRDLRAQQVESSIEAAFTIPPKTTDNLAVTDIAAVELRVGRMPEGGWNQDAWAAAAKAIAIDANKPGPVETTADVREFTGQEVVLAVRMANKKGRSSAWSNLVTLRVESPVVTPSEFTVDSAPNGAVVAWKGYPGPVIVYRDGVAIGEGSDGQFADPRAQLDKIYKYEIQARGDKAQGRRIGPVTLTVEDRFAPAAPTGLNAVAGAGTVELSWNPNPETDILAYAVVRAAGAGAFAVVAKSVDAPAYTDRDVQRGVRYRYMVTALDLRKNQSVTSQEVEITVP